ncbi:MAG: ATP-binding protein [Ruminococcus sp.]|nr:ATP-binding protein [Ruminococcus sp.]
MKELTIIATPENVDTVIDFVDEQLEEYGCGMREKVAIDVAVDELITNIVHYAYKPDVGYATVRVDVLNEPLTVEVTFIDNGKQYDPLANEDPDTSLPLEDRPIGGLGLLIVKKSMDFVSYEYKDGKNILTIRKNCSK